MILKKLISTISAIAILSASSVLAYSPGPTEYSMNLSEITQSTDAVLSNGALEIKSGGSVTLDAFLPFDTKTLSITYSSSSLLEYVKLKINSVEQSVYLGSETGTKSVTLDNEISMGNTSITISSQMGTVSITDVTFKKTDSFFPAEIAADIEYSDYDAALQTAAVFKTDAVVFKDKGSIKYLSYENMEAGLKTVDGVIYAPVEALTLSLSLYAENNNTNVLLRSADNSIENTYTAVSENGIYYLPVKTVAENFGAYIFERDDFLVIDYYKLRGKEIIENDTVFTILENEFSTYLTDKVQGNVYHVSKAAAVGGDGSEENPFSSISEAAALAKAGDKVIIHEGVYCETVTPENNGDVLNPIIFEAAENECVTVSGFDEIRDFKPYRDGIYVASLSEKLDFGTNLILYNDNALAEGREPDSNTSQIGYPEFVTSPLWPTKGDILTVKNTFMAESASGALADGEENYYRGATFVTLKRAGWNLAYGCVADSTGGMISMRDVKMLNYFGLANDANDWGYLTNSIKTVDMPGEWYSNGGAIYIIPPEGVSGSTLTVKAKQRYKSFDLTDRSFIQIKNINTTGASIVMSGESEFNIIDGGKHSYTSHFTYPKDKNGYLFEDYTSENNPCTEGKSGIYIGGKNNAFINSEISYSAGSGLILTGQYAYIKGNKIHDTGYGGISELAGIMIASGALKEAEYGGGHEIVFNTVHNTGRSTITQCSRENEAGIKIPLIGSEICYNDLYHANIIARDTGIVYENGVSMGNDIVKTELHHNVIHDSVTNSGGTVKMFAGIYHDNNTANNNTHRNIIYYTDSDMEMNYMIYVQKASIFPDSYSVARAYDNKELGLLESGFDKTDAGNYPDGKIFNNGA